MYVVTNRDVSKRRQGLKVFGSTPNDKGPNELRLVKVTGRAGDGEEERNSTLQGVARQSLALHGVRLGLGGRRSAEPRTGRMMVPGSAEPRPPCEGLVPSTGPDRADGAKLR